MIFNKTEFFELVLVIINIPADPYPQHPFNLPVFAAALVVLPSPMRRKYAPLL